MSPYLNCKEWFDHFVARVGKRVHKFALIGKCTPEMASGTELFPDDWSPHTMICGRET